MYDSLTKFSGIEAVRNYLSGYKLEQGPDGLSLMSTDSGNNGLDVLFPERLRDWLVGLRLLRNIPLSYLVPDAALLPPESIRFFHVDPTWVDRVIDGVFAAANTGTVDSIFSYITLQAARDDLDNELAAMANGTAWDGSQIMTGMLIRSELVRRWPDMIIRAYEDAPDPPYPLESTMAVLRAEPISKDVYIALFAGQPGMVHVREPNVGTRYGVEPKNPGSGGAPYTVDNRQTDGVTAPKAPPLDITWRGAAPLRVIDLKALGQKSAQDTPRQVALNLEQRSYVMVFKDLPHREPRGSEDPKNMPNTMQFRRGRSMTLDKLKDRKNQLEDLGS